MICYLDNAATAKTREEAIEAMLPAMRENYGNPSGGHSMARDARRSVEDARDLLAGFLGIDLGEVIFTSGGTESDNLAITGVHSLKGGTVACSAIEHDAVLNPVEKLGGVVLGVGADGVVELNQIAELPADTSIVSVMAANNESGVIQPISEVARRVRAYLPEAIFHVDAVQGFCWLDLVEVTQLCDMLSLSGHKFGAPKGVGALVVKAGTKLDPLQLGGGQERERRAGTHNVPGIVGMAAAAEATMNEKSSGIVDTANLRDVLIDGVLDKIDGVKVTAENSDRLANIAHLCFEDVDSEALLFLLEREGIMASSASSCASGAMESSHVLSAMGVPAELSKGSLRFSLSYATTEEEIQYVLEKLPAAVEQIRSAKQ